MSQSVERYYVAKTTYSFNNSIHHQSLQAGPFTATEAYAKALDMAKNSNVNEIFTVLEMVTNEKS